MSWKDRVKANEKSGVNAQIRAEAAGTLYSAMRENAVTSGEYKDKGQMDQFNRYISEYEGLMKKLGNSGYDVSGQDSVISSFRDLSKEMSSTLNSSLSSNADYNKKITSGKSAYEKYLDGIKNGDKKKKSFLDYFADVGYTGDTSLPTGGMSSAVLQVERDHDKPQPINISGLTPSQLNDFYYLYADSPEEAKKFAEEANNKNAALKAEGRAAWAGKNTGTRLLSTAAQVPASALSVADYLNQLVWYNATGEAYTERNADSPTMVAQSLIGGASKGLTEKGMFNTGFLSGEIDEDIPIVGGLSLGSAYQLGTSMVNSAVNAATQGGFGAIFMGGSAASNAFYNALDKGATAEQAIYNGLAQGTAEAIFEYISLDKLINMDVSAPLMKNILKQSGVEASEEAMTSIANYVTDAIIMKDKSEYEALMQEYNGDKAKVYLAMVNQIAQDAIGGFISGGGLTLINYGTNGVYQAQQAKKTYGPGIQDLVSASLELNPGNELATKIQGRLDSNKNVSGRSIMKLVNQNETDMLTNDKNTIKNAASQQLAKYGETGDVNAIAEAITKQAAGETLSKAEKKLISESKYGQRVANELDPANIRSQEYNTEWAEKLGTDRINAEAYSRIVQEAQADPESVVTEQQPVDTVPAIENTPREQIATPQEGIQAPKAVAAPVTPTEAQPAKAPTAAVAESKTAEEADKSMSVKDVSTKYGKQAGAFIHTYQQGQDVKKYDEAYSAAYDYGKTGVPIETVKGLDSVSYLTEKQRELAYEAGKAAADTEANTKQQDRMQKANGKTGRKKGVVKGEGVTIADIKSAFNDQQGRAYRVLSTIAEATGIDIVLYKSVTNDAGEFEGAQGAFKHASPDKIFIDLNAGLETIKDVNDLAKYAMLRTFCHEFTHFVEYWNPVQYNEFRKLVFNELTARGENVNDLIEAKIEETGLSYDKASREVVAEAMTDILPDSKFVQNMAENHKSIFNKLLEKLKEFVADLREYFNTIGANRDAGAKALKEQVGDTIKYIDSIVDMFDTVAAEAVENYQNAFAIDEIVAENSNTTTATEENTVTEEAKPEPKTTTSEYGFTITDNIEFGSVEIKFNEKPSEAVREVLKAKKFRWHKAKGVWYGKTSHEAIAEALNKAYEAEQAPAPVDTKPTEETPKSDFAKVWESASQEAKDEIIQAIYENTKMSHMAPTEVRETAPVYSATKETPVNADVSIDYSKTNEIAKKIIKQTKKGMNTYTFTAKVGNSYIAGNSFVVSVVDLDTFKSLFETVAKPAIDGNALEQIVNNKDYTKFIGKAYSYLSNSGYTSQIKSVLLESAKDQILINEKYAKYFDGYDFYHIPGKKNLPILIKDLNGNTIGIVMPMRIDKPINTEKLDISKMKSFRNTQESVEEIKEERKNGGKNEADKGTIQQSESDGDGATRILEEVQAEDVQRAGGQRESVAPDTERGGQTVRDGSRTDPADRTGGSERDGKIGDLRRDDGLSQEEAQAKEEKLKETVSEQIEQQSTEKPKGSNFVIGDSLNLPTGEKARFRANVDAIKLIKQLEDEGRNATAAEQEVLSKYVGWGGLSNAFGELKWNRETRKSEMTAKPGWEKEFAEFRQLVTDGIITEEEYQGMSGSTKNAHYTSIEVIKAMYDGLEQLGFKGGRMLEPSSGVGNFVGGMPTSMSSKVKSWTMVELDRITGQIAKYLYPQANVRIQGFETANIPDNYMDVAIGNVPFGNYGVVDRHYPKRITKAIHNYFFAKTLDKVRPGGIVMFITSSFTMNGQDTAIRQYIMDRADLLGAIRLPNTAFAGNAGTEVVTDILVLKKRAPGTEYAGEAFLEAPYRSIGNSWQGANVNEYFDNHPEMVLGTAEIARGMYANNSLTYSPLTDKGPLGDQIREAFKNITGKMDYIAQATPEKSNFAVERANKKTKQLGLEVKEDGKVYRNVDGKLEVVSNDKATAERVAGLLGIRDAYKTLVNYLQQGQDAKFIKKARNELNKAYDDFVKKYGLINSPKNKSAIADDPDSFSLLSLENYDATKKTATKADIFTKDTITANKTITHVDDVATGVIVSINRTGGIDTSLIAKITGKTEEAVTRELIDSRLAFKTKDGGLETPETYLAGNVRAKLRDAEALVPFDKDYQNNVDELRKVIPKDIPFNDIYAAVGTPWIPNNVYADFIAEMLGGVNSETSYSGPDVTVGRTNTGDFKIVINNARLKSRYQNTQKWGTRRKSFLDIMTALMSSTSIKVNDYIEDENGRKKPVLNKVETAAAQEKAEEISKEFQEWLWRDENRRKELTSLYNETFNALVTPKYNGANLTINGLNAEFGLREHQANAVQRIISSGGNTLLAHKVGAGKTLEMAAAAMKLRELGIVKKPMFVVPKALVAQWGVEFKSYFPASKLLVADEKSFTKANRKTFSNRIANGDYDAIILSYEQFEKIPMSAAYLQEFYQQQINEIIDAIAEEKAESKGKGITVKEMEKKKSQLEKKIAELTTKTKDEDNIDFEQLGVDSLFVDEAHNFKNLQYTTRMSNVSGLSNSNGSQRAFDLFGKVRYLQGLNGGRGIVFATATPVMNSMAEMYIMQKYLQSDMLEQLGLKTFDAWAKQFGEVVNSVEIKPSGQGFRVKQTFSNFRNLNELQLLFCSFSDVLTQVPGLKIPKMKGGKVNTVVCEPGQFQQDYMAELEKRADNVKNVDPSEDNMLKITSDGRKVSYTQRMIDPTLPYEPGCKIYRCCDNVLTEYKASSKIKGTQIIFCDMATPKGKSKSAKNVSEEIDEDVFDTESAQLYDDMRAYLVKKGIPAKEIAFIHEANTDAKKKQLFADVNDGKVRVLIGSTGKMGVGMNAQKRIVAIHHLDAPWRPGDVEQRDGRAFRQKNINDEVSKYTYVTEGSFDARLWDILDRKQHFIEQIMNGEDVGRSAEDTGDVTLSAAEVKALASGNPMIMEQVQLSNDLSKLQDLKRAYNSSIVAAKAKLLEDEQRIAMLNNAIAKGKEDIKSTVDTYSEGKFSMTIGNKKFSDKKDAGVALAAEIVSKAKEGEFTTVGKFAGFELRVIKQKAEYIGSVAGAQNYKFNVYPDNTTYMINHIIGVIQGIDRKVNVWTESLAEVKTDLAAQENIIASPFAKQAELDQKTARFNEVMAILNPKEEQVIGDEEETQYQARNHQPELEGTQYQQRKSPLTDREVLSIAASEVNVEGLTDFELDALNIFKQRLDNLYELEQKRAEEGRKYKEQQFGANVDREEAQKTLNRMKVLDEQIKRASSEVLDVEKKEVLKRVLQRSRRVIENAEREHGQELLKRYRDRRKNAADIKKYRDRIKADTDSLTQWILHPNNKNAYQHVPDALKNSVIPFLTSIDFTSKQRLRGGEATKADKEFITQLNKLKGAIKQNIDVQGLYSGYNDLPEGFMDEMQKFIDSAQALAESKAGEFVINRMTAEELKTLSKLVRVVKKLIIHMNAYHQNAMFQHVYEGGDNSIEFMSKIGNATNTGAVSEFLMWQQMRPAYAFERFGKGGEAIYDEFRRGQATLAFNTVKIKEFSDKTYTDAEVKAWDKETKTFVLGEDTVKIPVSYLMGFYELSKQKDSLEHILGEGIRVATYKNGKEKISDVGHALTPGDISTMIKALTPRQMEVADKLQKFMSTQGAEWGNYVSVARFGEELFTNPEYYPINSDGRHLEATADEHPSAASLYALLNMSFTKSRKEGANNRIVLYSIFDVFANHMSSMAQYNAFALPILDSLKWFNYQQVEKNEDGSKTILGSVREQMARVYGVPEESRPGSGRKGYAENFVIGIIKAFNGTETQGIPTDMQGLNAMHKYNMAQVAYNVRVVLQQPMAITRAGLLVDYKNIIKGLRLSPSAIKKNIEEMHKYSGIAVWKSLGFYDINISRGLTDIIKHNDNALDKIGDIGIWGAEKADLITWAAIWSACKDRVMRDYGRPTTEEYYAQVTKLFEDVIYKTQVVDSVLTKNEWLRSKGAWARLLGSFMSEPTTTASMLLDAYYKYRLDLQRGLNRQQAWKLNGRNIGRTAYVYAVGAVLLAAIQAVADAWRDDDDYQTFIEKWLEAFGGNLVDELMPFNKLPILRDFYELVKSLLETWGVDTYGTEPRSVIFQWRDYLVKSSEIFHDKIMGEDTNYEWYGGAYKLLQAVSGITGLPMAAVTREIIGAWNNIVGGLAPSLKVKTYDAGTKGNIKYAYQDGHLTEEEAINELIETGEAKDKNEAYWIVKEWETGESKYAVLEEAVMANDSAAFRSALSELTANGVEEKAARSKAASLIADMYNGTDDEPASINRAQAINMFTAYAGMERADAETRVEIYDWQKQGYDVDVSSVSVINDYKEYCEPSGISKSVYYDAYLFYKDSGVPGEAYSKTKECIPYIDSLPLSNYQKTQLALCWWSEKTVNKYKTW